MHTHANKHARSTTRASKTARKHRAAKWARVAIAAAAPVFAAGAVAAPALATPQTAASSHYSFRTIDNGQDPTFNQLLGINQNGLIAGYFGSGMMGHPNKGYLLVARHGQQSFMNQNWPESTQTQVTGLNDRGVTVGFWSSTNNGGDTPVNDNRAFVSARGYFIDGDFPTDSPASPPVDQLLGVNDHNVAVGFYNDAAGDTHAYTFDIRHNRFNEVTPAGIMNPTGAAINNNGDIAGFGTDNSGDAANGNTVGYLLRRSGRVTILAVPGASSTQALGINDSDEVVGFYTDAMGNEPRVHLDAFRWFQDPRGRPERRRRLHHQRPQRPGPARRLLHRPAGQHRRVPRESGWAAPPPRLIRISTSPPPETGPPKFWRSGLICAATISLGDGHARDSAPGWAIRLSAGVRGGGAAGVRPTAARHDRAGRRGGLRRRRPRPADFRCGRRRCLWAPSSELAPGSPWGAGAAKASCSASGRACGSAPSAFRSSGPGSPLTGPDCCSFHAS